MNDTNDIIDQIEVKKREIKDLIQKENRHFETANICEFLDSLDIAFADFKEAEYDNRTDEEIAADAHGSRMCDKFHAKRDM